MTRLPALTALWLPLTACGVLATDSDPEGTWVGECAYVLSLPALDIEQAYDFEAQLDVTVEWPVASALEVATELSDDGSRGLWLYDGTWTPPFLDLQDEVGQVIHFVLSDDGERMEGSQDYELEDTAGGEFGDCTFVRSEGLLLP